MNARPVSALILSRSPERSDGERVEGLIPGMKAT
jgi:hypothetical protein